MIRDTSRRLRTPTKPSAASSRSSPPPPLPDSRDSTSGAKRLGGFAVPEADGAVAIARGDAPSVGAERHRLNAKARLGRLIGSIAPATATTAAAAATTTTTPSPAAATPTAAAAPASAGRPHGSFA